MIDKNPAGTLLTFLSQKAQAQPNEILYTFLTDGESEETHLTNAQLDRCARAIAAQLLQHAEPGNRALLLYQPGLDYICGFFGCLYAGIIAVPAYPPRNARNVPRIQVIAADAQARLCLTSSSILARSKELFGIVSGLDRVTWLATDTVDANSECDLRIELPAPQTIAYLQYTSGSTNNPKGVMVSHHNLIHNLSFLCDDRGHTKIVSWLPFFHDMGLIYGILQGLYGGFPSVLFAPASFLQKPVRWLNALSRHQASTAIAPNFAYDLCVQKVTDAEKQRLDLSKWKMALNAAEPVRAETLRKFAAAFECCGFRGEFLKPSYGLAEATLGVSILKGSGSFTSKIISKESFQKNRIVECSPSLEDAVEVAGCGQWAMDQTVVIANPETLAQCASDEVGEIWISGPSIAKGYWRRPTDTKETFEAFLADNRKGPFLRTGDLGFISDGQLYITGRLKDLIIIRGANHYPQDIEMTVQKTDLALQSDAGAAFSIEVDGEERLVIVQELVRHPKSNLDEVIEKIRSAIAETHGLQVYAIALIRNHTIPKTTSGKIQRKLCRTNFLTGSLEPIFEWRNSPNPLNPPADSTISITPGKSNYPEITLDEAKSFLLSKLAAISKLLPNKIDSDQPFSFYGLDSLGSATLTEELETRIGRRLPSSLLYDYPTVNRLADYLSRKSQVTAVIQSPENKALREAIAIVGIGCRFPKAKDHQEFWNLLTNGIDAISEVPSDRWNADRFYSPIPATPGKMNTRWGGFLEKVNEFAADFFEISPREAAQMDPQQRLLLETAWHALEDAFIPAQSLAGSKTGVFVGISSFDYSLLQFSDPLSISPYAGTGIAHSIAANRISYFFDFHGPSVAVDTACSSSLVAVHQACESLLRNECTTALAGGVNLVLSPELTIALSQARMMASDGRCKTFDARADGYVRGEGCGIIVLKRLSHALRDQNQILALIPGSSVNQDGRSNGLTAPNGPAQEAVVAEAIATAGISPEAITYIECHGTGTALGDPQEIEALQNVLGKAGTRRQKCWLGSVKTNIGHLEAASGIAGLIKVVLALRHKKLPPHLHLQNQNSKLRFDANCFAIATSIQDWTAQGTRIAGVSSFGFGGTNAHVIVAEYAGIQEFNQGYERPLHLLTISGRNEEELKQSALNLIAHLEESPAPFADICYSINSGRSHFPVRLAIKAHSSEEAKNRLISFLKGERANCYYQPVLPIAPAKIVFVFSQQSFNHTSEALKLYRTQPQFRLTIDQCSTLFRSISGIPISCLLTSNREALEERAHIVCESCAFFSIMYGLAKLWESWGITPNAAIGHGLGELVASCIANAISLENAIKLITEKAVTEKELLDCTLLNTPQIGFEYNCKELSLLKATQPSIGAVDSLNSQPTVFIEFGPSKSLAELRSQHLADEHLCENAILVSPLNSEADCWATLISSLAVCYTAGISINWKNFDKGYNRRHAPVPYYPFQRSPYWLAPPRNSFQKTEDSWPTLMSTGTSQSECPEWQSILSTELEKFDVLNLLARAYVLNGLNDVGFSSPQLASLPIHERLEQLQISGLNKKVLRSWLFHLEKTTGSKNIILEAINPGKPLHELELHARRLWEEEPYFFELVNTCGKNLGDILSNRQSPISSIFPAGSSRIVEKIYRDSNLARYFNSILERLLRSLNAHKSSTTLHVLEVGAGTGGTTSHLTSLLAEGSLHYTFTDLGPTFIQNAREKFGKYPSFEARLLDLEECPEQQGFALQTFDVIIASNVLHATRDLRKTVSRLKSLLKPGGHFLIWEATAPQWWLNITFGLLEGWHRYEDCELRERNPLLSSVEWIDLLHQCGFHRASAFPSSCNDSPLQHIILAESNRSTEESHQLSHIQNTPEQPQLKTEQVSNLFYKIDWEENSELIKSQINCQSSSGGSWLIFADQAGIASMLANLIREKGGRTYLVEASSAYHFDGNDQFRLSPGERNHLSLLITDLRTIGLNKIEKIIYLWGSDLTNSDFGSQRIWENITHLGIETVSYLLQALSECKEFGIEQKIKLWLVTRNTQNIRNEESFVPLVPQSVLWGLANVISVEHPSAWGGIIDLGLAPDKAQIELIWRILGCKTSEKMWALRESKTFVRRLAAQNPAIPQKTLHFRFDATYLITGGLGGMGLCIARWMAERGAKHLLLISRTKLPARSQWRKLAETESNTARIIREIIHLERSGATVHLIAADVADQKRLSSALKRFHSEAWPPIQGVIHAAGVLEDQTISTLTAASVEAVTRPKFQGTWNLHQQFKGQPLDFFALFSSVAAVLGSPGQASHAAANAFLDNFSQYRTAQALSTQSINWGPWAEIGAAARKREQTGAASNSIRYLSPSEGLQAFEAALDHNKTNCIIVSADWNQFAQELGRRTPFYSRLVSKEISISDQSSSDQERNNTTILTGSEKQDLAQLEPFVVKIAAGLLMQSESRINSKIPLHKLGFDSLMAVQLQNEIEFQFKVSIPALDIVQSSVAEIIQRIMNEPSVQCTAET